MGRTAKIWMALASMALVAPLAQAAKPPAKKPRVIDATSFEKAADVRSSEVVRPAPKLAQQSVPLAARFVEMQPAPRGGGATRPEPVPDEMSGYRDSSGTPLGVWSDGPCDGPCDGSCDGSCGGCDEYVEILEGPPCDECGNIVCGCEPYWRHRSYVFGEYLYLLPADADLAHAFQQNGIGGLGTVPDGSVGVLQPNFNSAYRTGFGVALGCFASIGASYTNFHSHTTDNLLAPAGVGRNVNSLVVFPGTINTGSTAQDVGATYDIDYQLVDLDYRRLLSGGCRHGLNYVLGARYGKLGQSFSQLADFAPPTGIIQTSTNIDFEGIGLRAGLDGDHQLGNSLFAVYGKATINVLFGEFRSSYTQFDTLTTITQAQSSWNDRRSLPILDYEVGLQWTGRRGHWRASAGYYSAFWFNTVTTGEWIQAVQGADFVNVGETISFNGLVSRVEYRF